MRVIDELMTSALSVPEISLGLLIHAAVGNRAGFGKSSHKRRGVPLLPAVCRQSRVNLVRVRYPKPL